MAPPRPRGARRLVALALLLGLFGVALWLVTTWVGGPLYRPGALGEAARAGRLDPPPAGPQAVDGFHVTPSITLHHRDVGQGPPVVVVHGGPGVPIADPWPGLGHLADRYAFVFYDQRGCGRSTRPITAVPAGSFWQRARALDAELGVGAQLADVERIRRLLGRDRLVLVGEGAGATLAALYAAELPEHVAGLVLVAPVDLVRVPATRRGPLARLLTGTSDEALSLMPPSLRELEHAMSAGDAELSRELAATTAPSAVAPGGLMALAVWLSLGRPHDDRAALDEVTAPVLVVGASAGDAAETAKRMAAYFWRAAEVHSDDPAAALRDPRALEPLLGPWLDALPRW